MSARLRLREETQREHEAVDAAWSAFDLSSARGYRDFMSAQARAFLPIEAAVERAGADLLIDDWGARRRALRRGGGRADDGDSGDDAPGSHEQSIEDNGRAHV